MRLLALALLFAAPAVAQNAAIGVNAAIKNQVSMKTAADPAARPAVLRESVHLGDAISSGPARTPLMTAVQYRACMGLMPRKSIATPTSVDAAITP